MNMTCNDVTEVRLPIYWASYLVNNDASGLEDGEEDQVQQTLENLELDKWICVDVKDDISFEYPFLPDLLGGDYCTYVFHNYGN
tara:strand:+ start:314 stop:565 length:252 start_codon:yes stop_codon:yes gene_type:complete